MSRQYVQRIAIRKAQKPIKVERAEEEKLSGGPTVEPVAGALCSNPAVAGQISPARRAQAMRHLQRTHGNQTVQRMLRRQPMEEEELMAKRMDAVQRQDWDEEELQAKRFDGLIQAQLTVGPVDDPYEKEADQVASQVMQMPETAQRQEMEEEELLMTKPLVQRSIADGGSFALPEDAERRLNSSRGQGESLPDDIRTFMEPRFGSDFSNVKIHTGGAAVQLSQDMQARAFTHGTNIYFNRGQYKPETEAGKELLAHELTHVIQQGGSQPIQREDE